MPWAWPCWPSVYCLSTFCASDSWSPSHLCGRLCSSGRGYSRCRGWAPHYNTRAVWPWPGHEASLWTPYTWHWPLIGQTVLASDWLAQDSRAQAPRPWSPRPWPGPPTESPWASPASGWGSSSPPTGQSHSQHQHSWQSTCSLNLFNGFQFEFATCCCLS